MFVFSYVLDDVCHANLLPNLVCTFLPLRVTSTMILSIFRWVVISFSNSMLLSGMVSQPYVITGNIHLLNAFLFNLIATFFSYMISSLPNSLPHCPILLFISSTWSWSLVIICPTIYVSVVLLDLLSIDNHIILVDMLVTRYFSSPTHASYGLLTC